MTMRQTTFVLGALLMLVTGRSFGAELPTIDLVYPSPDGTVFDRNCLRITQKEVPKGWIEETARRRADFQATWNQEGPIHLKTVIDVVGKPFPYRDMQATLTVCDVGASMSSPLLIDVRPWMPGGRNPPMWRFTLLVFHELMHHYTRDVYARSRLREKYASEQLVTRNHLHVLALEKLVLLKLDRRDDLALLDKIYRGRAPNDPYRRAWEIIEVEGYDALVSELKEVAPTPR